MNNVTRQIRKLLTLSLTLVAYAYVESVLGVNREDIKRHLEHSPCRNSYLSVVRGGLSQWTFNLLCKAYRKGECYAIGMEMHMQLA